MPKKRHQPKFSKPPSTAPPSLSTTAAGSSGGSSNIGLGPATPNSIRGSNTNTSSPFSSRSNAFSDDNLSPSVNELLADLRRKGGPSRQPSVDVQQLVAPSVPPMIRDILQLPVVPAPRPRQPQRPQPGRRLPAGPATPPSWLSQSRHAPRDIIQDNAHAEDFERRVLPDSYLPEQGSLIDITLRNLAQSWAFQKEYWIYYIHELPTHIRTALVTYLNIWSGSGVTVGDLQIILRPPRDENAPKEDDSAPPGESLLNDTFRCLDLAGSIGRSLKITELSSLLFPSSRDKMGDLQESWDAPDATSAIPKPLLPKLTHLSLAIDPRHGGSVSWRHLLSFAHHLPTLTHLSLAYWPEPTLTPNAKFSSVVSPQGQTIQYGGTGPYSHSLDNDWSEAVMVMRRLSKALYGLEFLDLTGCADWCQVLFSEADHDTIDWVSDWGKMERLLLYPGYSLVDGSEVPARRRFQMAMENAARVERHVRIKRSGRGRFISVERAAIPEISIDDLLGALTIGP